MFSDNMLALFKVGEVYMQILAGSSDSLYCNKDPENSFSGIVFGW